MAEIVADYKALYDTLVKELSPAHQALSELNQQITKLDQQRSLVLLAASATLERHGITHEMIQAAHVQ
jgi:hypothetical protein